MVANATTRGWRLFCFLVRLFFAANFHSSTGPCFWLMFHPFSLTARHLESPLLSSCSGKDIASHVPEETWLWPIWRERYRSTKDHVFRLAALFRKTIALCCQKQWRASLMHTRISHKKCVFMGVPHIGPSCDFALIRFLRLLQILMILCVSFAVACGRICKPVNVDFPQVCGSAVLRS